MSYATYQRRPAYQRTAYAEPTYVDVQQPYAQQGYSQQPISYASRSHGRHHHSSSHLGHGGYTTVNPQYVTTGGHSRHVYPSSHHSYSRHAPNVVVGSTRNLGHHTTVSYLPNSSSSRYYAQSGSGHSVPVVSGRSYRDEGVTLSTRIRRLFGLGPPRHSGHRGVAVHIKRGSNGRYTTSNDRGRSSRDRVYTV